MLKKLHVSFWIYVGMVFGVVSTALAGPQTGVLPKDLDCILENREAYRDQGDIITLNFKTCPEPPTFSETFKAHRARNVFPPRQSDQSNQNETRTEGGQVEDRSAIAITKDEFDCLIANIRLINPDNKTGKMMILPEFCQSLSR